MTSPASHRRHRRVRRLKRRGRLTPAEAQALSMRSRDEWPITKSITRFHRSKWNVKPREKWLDRREVEL